MKAYETVTESLNDLAVRGYTAQFNMEHDCLTCEDRQIRLRPEEFEIDEVYRFEGDTDPGDEMIVYAISSVNGKIKGTLANAYGMHANSASNELISKLRIHSNR